MRISQLLWLIVTVLLSSRFFSFSAHHSFRRWYRNFRIPIWIILFRFSRYDVTLSRVTNHRWLLKGYFWTKIRFSSNHGAVFKPSKKLSQRTTRFVYDFIPCSCWKIIFSILLFFSHYSLQDWLATNPLFWVLNQDLGLIREASLNWVYHAKQNKEIKEKNKTVKMSWVAQIGTKTPSLSNQQTPMRSHPGPHLLLPLICSSDHHR